jgi:hypothetical protein
MLYCIIFGILYMVIFFQLMQCNCIQRKSSKIRKTGELLGHSIVAVLALFLLFFVAPTALTYIVQQGGPKMVLSMSITLVGSKLGGWCFVFLIKMVLFTSAWRKQTKEATSDVDKDGAYGKPSGGATRGGFYVSAEDYQAYASLQLGNRQW